MCILKQVAWVALSFALSCDSTWAVGVALSCSDTVVTLSTVALGWMKKKKSLLQISTGARKHNLHKGKVQKKRRNKLTSVSFMYVCVAANGEMLVFFPFFPQQ